MILRKLVLIGGGGFAREVLWVASVLDPAKVGWTPAGFIDDEVDSSRQYMSEKHVNLPVLGSIQDHQPRGDEVFICAIGKTKAKLKCASLISQRGGEFVNVVHPSAHIAPDARIGLGLFLFINSLISTGAAVGDHTSLIAHTSVGHDAAVGNGCTLSSYCDITANVRLGTGVLMGSHASILRGITVGDFATIGAGSVVIRKVPPETSVMGVPARAIL
ncbi:MAG TPA: NeuD/PglB/VioB family sugar acetyltransferase [Candidatus Acidoferrum sp.]|jgi:sugar O-acyltransferase (sialic acid O-acetyltransferase NeuD family)